MRLATARGFRVSVTDVKVIDEILSEKHKELAPDLDDGEFFEFFAAQQILRNYASSPTDIQNGMVGGSGQKDGKSGSDGGIDGFYLLVNGRFISDVEAAEDLQTLKQNVAVDLILIQSTREQKFLMNRVLRMSEAVENILQLGREPKDFTENYNESLLDAIERFRTTHRVLAGKFPTINVSYFQVTKGDRANISADVKKKADGLEEKTKALLATVTVAKFAFVGARELIELATKPPKTTSTLPFVDSMDSPKGGYAAFVKLSDFYKFITDDGEMIDHLFDFNVRDYQGDVEVNKAIRDTLTDQPPTEDFWWLNNGITLVATRVSPGGHRELVIEDPYIVNGLQTSQEMYDYFRVNGEALSKDDRQALVRIIASTDSTTQDSIIRATNSQTGMGPASLWATDPIHRDLEKLFPSSGLYYDRRKNYWRNRDIAITKIVSIQDLAQSIISMVLRAPDDARARPSKYFKQKNRALYQKVFAPWFPIDIYTACATTRKRAEVYLRTVEADSRHRNNLLFYVLLTVGCLATKSRAPQPKTLAKYLTAVPVSDNLLKEALDIVRPLYERLGADDKAAKGPELVGLVQDAIGKRFPKKGQKP
jgi:hypothetical protein